MPIPLFTASEKPSNTETLSPHEKGAVTSTPLTSGTPQGSSRGRRRSSTGHRQEPAAASGNTAGSVSASGREMTREEREAADRAYEERIEEEYAKREGGA